MARYAVVNIQVAVQGASGQLTVNADAGSNFDVTDGVWQRVWIPGQAGDQCTETLRPDQMVFTNTQFVYSVDNSWGQNHQFSIRMTTDGGTATASLTGSGFLLATNPPVYYRGSQNDSHVMKSSLA
jgi:hypothetical protein